MDELQRAGLSEEDIFRGQVTEKWRVFMKGQIKRARMFFVEAEKGVAELNAASRWPVRGGNFLRFTRNELDCILTCSQIYFGIYKCRYWHHCCCINRS